MCSCIDITIHLGTIIQFVEYFPIYIDIRVKVICFTRHAVLITSASMYT